ncbi:class I SAM-dependent methyltransferase [Stutzerimonas stutzeri]
MTDDPTPHQSHLAFLDLVRAYELEVAREHLPTSMAQGRSCRLLEIGAGTGAQALRLSELGYTVSALEIKGSSYRNVRCFDVVEYDGVNIPLSAQSYDVVFSSNVLEHVEQLDGVLKETYRILSDDGVCIHLVPTSSCRAWTLAAHYVWLTRRIIQKLLSVRRAADGDAPRTPTTASAWLWTLVPPRHGERGNTVTEVYYYSRSFWSKKFRKSNFRVTHIGSNQLFYTMANSLGPNLSIKRRRFLAKILGSACRIYVLQKMSSQ